jgi:ribosomal protein L32E
MSDQKDPKNKKSASKIDNSILEITPFDDVTKRHPPVAHPVLLQHPFSLLEVAPPGAGKTTLLVNQILKQYKGYFHDVHVWSPTIEADPKWRKVKDAKDIVVRNKKLEKLMPGVNADLKKPKLNITKGPDMGTVAKQLKPPKKTFDGKISKKSFHRHYNVADLQDWMEKQEKQASDLIKLGLSEEEAASIINRTLHVFDDMVGSDLFQQSKRNNPFLELTVRRRHYNASIIQVTQGYREIPKTPRICVSGLIAYRISNPKELEAIYEEHPCDMEPDEWLRVYRHATAGKHDFFYVNYQQPTDLHRQTVYRNFTNIIEIHGAGNEEGEDGNTTAPMETDITQSQTKSKSKSKDKGKRKLEEPPFHPPKKHKSK